MRARRLPGFVFAFTAIVTLAACNPATEPVTNADIEAPASPAPGADIDTDPGATGPSNDAVPIADPVNDAPATEAPQGKRAAGEENLPMNAWRAFGNEPFWSVRLDGDTLVFSTPEDQAGRTLKGRRVPSLVGIVYMGTDDAGREFNLDIQPGECSDGMSDNTYQHVSTFIYGETTYRGCAEAAK